MATDYYVNTQLGNDGNGGTHITTDAKATLQAGLDLITTLGDRVFCTNGSSTEEAATAVIDFDQYIGDQTNPNQIIGVNSAGVEDGTKFKINFSGASSTNGLNVASYYSSVRNLELYNMDLDAILMTYPGCTFVNCSFHDCRSGINGNSKDFSADQVLIYNCTQAGINSVNGLKMKNSVIHTVGTGVSRDGIYSVGNLDLTNTLIYGASDHGIYTGGSATHNSITNCTIDGNTDDGIYFTSFMRGGTVIFNTRITNNGGYAINQAGSSNIYGDYNCFYSNTSGKFNTGDIYLGGENDIDMASDGYNDSGSGDYTLTSSAEGRNVSFVMPNGYTSYITNGAFSPDCSASGGGLIIHPGMNGGLRG